MNGCARLEGPGRTELAIVSAAVRIRSHPFADSNAILIEASSSAVLHSWLSRARSTKPLVNTDGQGVGIHGYDPVVYFTEGKAVKGDPQFSNSYDGAIYQ